MRLLIIVETIGGSPGGIVFERLIQELSKINPKLEVLCNKNKSSALSGVNITEINAPSNKVDTISKACLILFKRDLNSFTFSRKGSLLFNKLYVRLKPEVILVLTSAYSFRSINLGSLKAKEYNLPFVIHTIDPLPSIAEWGENYLLRKAIIRYLRAKCEFATLFSATNQQMVNYQKEVINLPDTCRTTVIYNPITFLNKHVVASAGYRKFLYMGSLYKNRNPVYLIEAFTLVNNIYPNIELQFVGLNFLEKDLCSKQSRWVKEKIKFHGWSDTPEAFLDKDTILIDIDANIQDDVFISSKLINYLSVDLPIICITPLNSPSRNLLNKMKMTVHLALHNKESIYDALVKALTNKSTREMYQERRFLREELSAENIAKKLSCEIEKATIGG